MGSQKIKYKDTSIPQFEGIVIFEFIVNWSNYRFE